MATRGRKPAPEKLRILKGMRLDRLNPDAPEGVPGRPERPGHLDDVASAEWDRIVGLLEAMGVLTQTDGSALAIYCTTYSRWLDARKAIGEMGLVIETDLGGVKPNPAVTIADRCEATMARMLTEFGCTPSSRARVKAAGKRKADPLGEYLAKAKKGG